MKTNRLNYIDTAKAFGIGLVVLGHLYLPNQLRLWIYAFHMPLFFLLSGLTFRAENIKIFLKKKAFSILLPYALFSVLTIAKEAAKLIIRGQGAAVGTLLKTKIPAMLLAVQNSKFSPGIYWFLPCLFVTELLLLALIRIFKNRGAAIIIVSAGLSTTQYFLSCRFNYSLPFCTEVALVALVFLAFGYGFKDNINRFMQEAAMAKKLTAMAVLFAIGTAGAVGNYLVSGKAMEMSVGYYGNYLFVLLGAIGLSLFVILLSGYCKSKAVLYVGKNTLFIYLFHPFLIHGAINGRMNKIVYSLVGNMSVVHAIVTTVLWVAILAIYIGGSYPYNYLMNKLKKR